MAEKNNQDLAVLGFSVKAESAMQALEQLDEKLRNIDANFKKADAALERKIVSTLAAIEKPMGKLDRTSAVVASFGEAFKQFAAAAKTDGLADVMTLLTKSLDAMAKSGLDKIAKTYARSLGEATMAFGQLGQNVTRTTNGIGSIMSSVFDKKNLDSVNIYLQRLEDARDLLKGYSGELKDKLPFGITLTNVKQAQTAIGGMITTVQKYASLLDPNNRREKTDVQNSANALLEQFKRNRQSVEDAINGLFPNGNTVKINVELANAETITNAIPKSIRVDIAENAQKTLAQYFTQLDAFKNGINALQVAADPESIKKLKDDVGAALLPTISFKYRAKDAVKDLYDALRSALEDKPFEVPVAFTFGNDVLSSKKAVEDPIEEFKNKVLMDMKADNWGAKVIKKNGAEWFSNIYNGAIREDFELANDFDELLQKIYQDEAEFMAQASKLEEMRELFKNGGGKKKEPASVLSSEAMSGIVSDFQKKIAPAAEEIQKLLNFEPKITIPDTISVDKITLSSKEVTVDTSSSVAKLMNEPLHVKGANVMVHPAAIKVDTAFVSPEAVKLIGVVQETLEKTVNVDPHVQAIGRVKDIYDKAAESVKSLHDELSSVAELLKGDLKDAFKTIISSAKGNKSDPLKELYRLSEQAEELERKDKAWNRLLEIETKPVDETNSKKRIENFKELRKELEFNERYSGNYDKNRMLQQYEANNALSEFGKGYEQAEEKVQALSESVKNTTDSIRKNANAMFQHMNVASNARVAFMGLDVEVRKFSWHIDNMPRIEPTRLTDPFVRLKAEIGETNSRLIDLSRTFGLYISGRSIINFFRQAAESANNFLMEIRRIQSLATDFDFGTLRNGLMDLDARFGNVAHNAQALYWAYSSGVRGTEKDLVRFTEIMSKTATTIKADVMPTLDAATSIMNAWNLSANSAAEIGDLLFGIVKYGKSNAQQLTQSLGYVVAPAAALNVELNELGAAATTLTKTMRTNRAFTYLSNILGKMAAPTKAVQEAAADLGVELSANAVKAKGLANVFREIREATGGDISKIAKLFPDLRGQRAAITLLSTQYKDFEQQLENMRGKAGSMQEALSKSVDTPEAQIRALKNSFAMLSIEVGNTVNNMLTLGGALGPVLKGFNSLEHTGREVMGNLVASIASWAGISVASKAFAAAQYAALQTTYQIASASADAHRLEMDNALLQEKQAIESTRILASTMKQDVVQKQLNDDMLRQLKTKDEIYKKSIEENKLALQNEQLNVKFVDEQMKRSFLDKTSAMGASQNRIAYLGQWLNDLQTGKTQQGIRDTQNLVQRLNADIQADRALLNEEQKSLDIFYEKKIKNLVEESDVIRKLMHQAIKDGDIGRTEDENSFYGKIVSTIKSNKVIAGQMAQFDTDERILQLEVRRYMLANESKKLVSDTNYEHSLLVKWVQDAISSETSKLKVLQAELRTMQQNNATSEETRALIDSIMQKQMDINALESEQQYVQDMIKTRTNELVGRQADQVRLLSEAAKRAKQILDADTTDLKTLRNKAEIEMKNAAIIGRNTLNAVRDAFNMQMEYQSVQIKINSLLAERATLIDSEGRLINESAEAAQRVQEIDREHNRLLAERNRMQKEFVSLGILAGNQDARNLKIAQLAKGGADLSVAVDALARNPKVVSEAIKAMSKDVGKGVFGGFTGGNFMKIAPWALSAMPGMQKWAMPLSMMGSFNVIGKAAGSFSKLTGSLLNTLGVTERLQKKGILSLNAGVEDLTKAILKSNVSIKGFKLSMESLKTLGVSGGVKGLAGFGSMAAWTTFGIGAASIIGGAIIAGLLLYFKSDKGGPLGDAMEKALGVDAKNNYGDVLKQRIEQIKQERMANKEMLIEMQGLVDANEYNRQQVEIQIKLASQANASQERINSLQEKHNSLQREYVSLLNGMSNLQAIGAYQKLRDGLRQQMHEAEQNRESNTDIMRFTIGSMWSNPSSPGALPNIQQIKQMQETYKQIQAQEAKDEANIEETRKKADAEFKTMQKGIAEFRYQHLMQQLETSRDTAFTAAKDATDKQRSAERMLLLSRKRIESVLSKPDSVVDLSKQTSEDLRNLIAKRIKDLSDAYETAQKAVDDAKDKFKEPNEKQSKHIAELEKVAENAFKQYENASSNITNAFNDYYQKIFALAQATVEADIDKSNKIIVGDAKKGEFFKDDAELLRTLPLASQSIREGIAQIEKAYNEGLGAFGEIIDEAERLRLKENLIQKAEDAIDKNTQTLISTEWSKLEADIAKMNKNAEYSNIFSNYDNALEVNRSTIEAYHDFIEKVNSDFEQGIGRFQDVKDEAERLRLKENLIQKAKDKILQGDIDYYRNIASSRENMASFMEQIANNMVSSQKDLFDFKMDSPAFAGQQKKLISQRWAQINSLLNSAALSRNDSLNLANIRLNNNDFAGAAKAFQDAERYGKEAQGFEQQKYELLKKQADIERSINDSMYALAREVQGKFESTAQTAVDASSTESIRLQMRRIGENIAPAIDTSRQTAEQKYFLEMNARQERFWQELAAQSQEAYNQIVAIYDQKRQGMDEPAKRIDDASIRMAGAADKLNNMSKRPLFNVKRL
ncbi:MAG: phage tail tape measure protein [Victivallales bacterium]|nr:phage tail tape measure protein [Victivallales bacterium]